MKLVFPADPLAVRQALKTAVAGLIQLKLCQDDKGVIEIVLAEVLNNVVEHAYSVNKAGVVELRAKLRAGHLEFTVIDEGLPLPDNAVPQPPKHDLGGSTDSLPEGGFGWFLVRELTQNLRYERTKARNRLDFSIALKATRMS